MAVRYTTLAIHGPATYLHECASMHAYISHVCTVCAACLSVYVCLHVHATEVSYAIHQTNDARYRGQEEIVRTPRPIHSAYRWWIMRCVAFACLHSCEEWLKWQREQWYSTHMVVMNVYNIYISQIYRLHETGGAKTHKHPYTHTHIRVGIDTCGNV